MPKNACLAIVLVAPKEPNHAASYHWCKLDKHDDEQLHECYCGIRWTVDTEDLVPPTPEMILWRTGSDTTVKSVSGRMLG